MLGDSVTNGAAPGRRRGKARLCRVLPLAAAAALTALAWGLYAACGASLVWALPVWYAAAAGILLPGLALAGLLEGPDAPLRPALAVLWGSAAFAAVTLAASACGQPRLVSLWVLAWTAASAVRLARSARLRQRALQALRFAGSADGCALCLLWAALVFLNALWAVRYAHPSAVGAVVPSQDFFWNLGNMESFALGLPLKDLRVDGVTVTYHFLTELYQAGLWFAADGPAYDVAAFFSYGPLAAGLVGCLYLLGRQLWPAASGRRGRFDGRALALAAMPLWLCCASLWKSLQNGASRFGNSAALHTLSNINGQATAYLFLALTLLLLERLFASGLKARPAQWAAACTAFYLLTFAKAPQAAILAIALACVLAVLLVQRRVQAKPAGLLFVLIPAGFALLYWLYFAAGANSSMRFSYTGTLRLFYFSSILNALQIRFPAGWQALVPVLWAAQSFLMAPAAFLAWLAAAASALRRRLRIPPMRLLWHACAAGGLLAFYLFDHASSSQIYFANLAVFCMGLFLLDRLPGWLAYRKPALRAAARCGAAALLGAGCLTAACLFVWLGRSARQGLAGPQQSESALVLTAGEEEACAWLAEQMGEEELFATNRMHTGAAMEGLSNVYTGLTGRRAYMESFKYAVSNMGERAGDVMTRYEQMNELFSPQTGERRLRQLCGQCGVTWLVYCPQAPGSEAQLACFEKVFQNGDCSIYRVDP